MQQPKALRPDTPLAKLDRMSREHWRTAAVGIFIEQNNIDVLRAVVDGGQDHWFKLASRIWDVHKFQLTDYDWMFNRVVNAVMKYDRQHGRGHSIHG